MSGIERLAEAVQGSGGGPSPLGEPCFYFTCTQGTFGCTGTYECVLEFVCEGFVCNHTIWHITGFDCDQSFSCEYDSCGWPWFACHNVYHVC